MRGCLNVRKKLLFEDITIIGLLSSQMKKWFVKRSSARRNPSQSRSLAESRINASAADVRGLMVHLKGVGYLLKLRVHVKASFAGKLCVIILTTVIHW